MAFLEEIENTYQAWESFLLTQTPIKDGDKFTYYVIEGQSITLIKDIQVCFTKEIKGNIMYHRLDGPSIITKHIEDPTQFFIEGSKISKEDYFHHPIIQELERKKRNKKRLKKVLESL